MYIKVKIKVVVSGSSLSNKPPGKGGTEDPQTRSQWANEKKKVKGRVTDDCSRVTFIKTSRRHIRLHCVKLLQDKTMAL